MKYYRHITAKSELHLYPLVCWHRGAVQSDTGFIESIVDRIEADPLARWVYMGDAGECVVKSSKGNIFDQTMNPTEQQNDVVRLTQRIRDKGLFGVAGNHGKRTFKETGLDFDETLCAKLGIPYFGTAAYWHLKLRDGSEHPAIFTIYTHHGTDSGVSIASKVSKATAFDRTFIADSILTAHSHIALDLPPRYYATLGSVHAANPIRWNATYEYICGSAYDSRDGYAEDNGYPPLLPSHLMITFKSTSHGEKTQFAEIIRKENI